MRRRSPHSVYNTQSGRRYNNVKLLKGFDNRSLWAEDVVKNRAALGVRFQSHAPRNCALNKHVYRVSRRGVCGGMVDSTYDMLRTPAQTRFSCTSRHFAYSPSLRLAFELLSHTSHIWLASQFPSLQTSNQQRAQGLGDGRLLRSST